MYSIFTSDYLKIWFDILTPKQLLFFESMIERLESKNKILCTSRNYREANELAKIHKLNFVIIGKHGGESKSGKLNASIQRLSLLNKKIEKFQPDVTISFCSPEAARISFGLQIPHIAFCNAPHSEAVLKLTLPLVQKLLIPKHIPKKAFEKYGIPPSKISQYNCMDEYLIIKNKKIKSTLPKLNLPKNKTIVFRTYEYQASYVKNILNTKTLLSEISRFLPDCNIIVLGRYLSEIKSLRKSLNSNIIILEKVVDSGELLSKCDVFIGSGGTMTTESVLRGIPTISYEAVPNLDEKYLFRNNLIKRAKSPKKISETVKKLLFNKSNFNLKSKKFVSQMKDPYPILQSTINEIKNL